MNGSPRSRDGPHFGFEEFVSRFEFAVLRQNFLPSNQSRGVHHAWEVVSFALKGDTRNLAACFND